jgi:hypothetical protein
LQRLFVPLQYPYKFAPTQNTMLGWVPFPPPYSTVTAVIRTVTAIIRTLTAMIRTPCSDYSYPYSTLTSSRRRRTPCSGGCPFPPLQYRYSGYSYRYSDYSYPYSDDSYPLQRLFVPLQYPYKFAPTQNTMLGWAPSSLRKEPTRVSAGYRCAEARRPFRRA